MNERKNITDITKPVKTDRDIKIETAKVKQGSGKKPIYTHQQQGHNEEAIAVTTIQTPITTIIETIATTSTPTTEETIESKTLDRMKQKSPNYNLPQGTTQEIEPISIIPVIAMIKQGIQKPPLLTNHSSAEHSVGRDSIKIANLPTEQSVKIETTFDTTTATIRSPADIESGIVVDRDVSNNHRVASANISSKKGFFRRNPIKTILIAIVIVLLLGALAVLIVATTNGF
ncbi:7392_t:CDS:2 [Ambispora gerdemannii]|uniref:7392_t:CDS:1 n=1 Tax=Ambispora gerdemannii TaxID=144530 RepID=A0A9N8V2N1_9GLOM|nr:7392_t:CDS:2 [Ambispora gerdemannii]